MLTSLLLLLSTAFQTASPLSPEASVAPAPSAAAASTASTDPALALPATAAPSVDPEDHHRRETLKNFWAMNFRKLGPDEWTYIAIYYGVRALFVVILWTLAWTLSNWSSSALRLALRRVRFDETLAIFLARLLRWAILLLVGITCLSYFGIETTGFAAVIGAAGLAIGLAFQGTLSNFAAGAMLLVFRPYKVGDLVNVANYLGKVVEIELFATAIDTLDNRRIIVPNSSIFGAVIENVTYHPVRRVDVNVGVAYSADIDETRAVLERAVRTVSQVVSTPEPMVALTDLGASSVNWQIRGWAKRDEFGDAKQGIIRAAKVELDRAKISIPFPQLDIHFDPLAVDDGRRAA